MRARKHAIVLVLPVSREHDGRSVAVMRRAVREYVTMAQWMQPPEATRAEVEATRLLLSLNVLVGNGDAEMARAVAISGEANQVPRQVDQILEDRVNEWRRRLDVGRLAEDARGDALLRLLRELAQQQFVVSVVTPADALPLRVCDVKAVTAALESQSKIEFVLLRDEDEMSEAASANVLVLLRAMNDGTRRSCSIREVEEWEVELPGMVKEWLHASSPWVRATLQLPEIGGMELEIRANFLLVGGPTSPGSSWTALHGAMRDLQFRQIVSLKSVNPALLIGCPLRISASLGSAIKVRALCQYLREESCGVLASCRTEGAIREFHLLTPFPAKDSTSSLFMYRVASSEEVLLPEVSNTDSNAMASEDDGEALASELERLRQLQKQAFNPFLNRSGILDEGATTAKEPPGRSIVHSDGTHQRSAAFPTRPRASVSSRRALPTTRARPSPGPSTTKKKRLL